MTKNNTPKMKLRCYVNHASQENKYFRVCFSKDLAKMSGLKHKDYIEYDFDENSKTMSLKMVEAPKDSDRTKFLPATYQGKKGISQLCINIHCKHLPANIDTDWKGDVPFIIDAETETLILDMEETLLERKKGFGGILSLFQEGKEEKKGFGNIAA